MATKITMFAWLDKSRFRFSIRTRLYILLILLTILPFLAYRFVVDLHRILLQNQVIIQKQTVVNLSYILENRTDLWALQIQSGNPTSQLAHLNLKNSAIWIVNEFGQATYVVGHLPKKEFISHGFFSDLGSFIILSFAKVIPYSLPYPYPQSKSPEVALVRQALRGQTYQQYRMDDNSQPISIMSATPLRVKNHIIGAIILEEGIGSLLSNSLQHFYKLIGISSLIFIIVLLGAIFYTATLSNRILRLDKDVRDTFDAFGKVRLDQFPDRQQRGYHDELSDLRHHIYEMLIQLGGYERYLKQLPKTLRHEIHNPLNRLSMSLDLLEKEVQHKQISYSRRALEQLKQIIGSLSEATSIEESLTLQEKVLFPIGQMLKGYLESVQALNPDALFSIKGGIPDTVQMVGDGFMIEQMMDKLISNAKDFNQFPHPIEIQYKLEKNEIILKIRNHGKPIPKGFETQIFEGMTSIREANSDQQPHLGLGLHIVKLIIDYHQGSIQASNWLDSSNSVLGAEFIIHLPVVLD